MSAVRVLAPLLIAPLLLLLLPDTAWAFGPATHVFLGHHLLDSLYLVPEAIATVLRNHPKSFLYGSVAADISFAKKYVPEGRNCHFWPIGEEILTAAENDRLRAVGYGYLGHLAADTIAHNYFIPRQLLLTSSTRALGHSYWEARMDATVGERYASIAHDVVMKFDHSEADALFDRVLSGTIFSFETNRRIFRGMIRIQDNERFQGVLERVVRKSRWELDPDDVDGYLSRAFDCMVDYFRRRGDSVGARMDPTGEFNLKLAKRVRRMALREGAWRNRGVLRDLAEDFFPLPDVDLGFWRHRAAAHGNGVASAGPG